MTELDPLLLSRLQFALNISFHILFPSISIGLAWVLFYFRVRFTRSGNQAWEFAYYFWVKIFALSFALGVVSGITMSFQFGTNWPGFMERVGNIAGPLLGYEVLTAFFLEAGFLGIMLFGKERVSNRLHLIASFLVAFGTTLSAFWILALNSWMQSPQGYYIEDGVFFASSWLEIIFNPTFPYMFLHVLNASFLTVAFLLAGISALRMQNAVDGPATQLVLRTGLSMALVLAPAQLLIGDNYGLQTLERQPAKIAAVEAIWETERGADLTLFGWPDEEEKKTHFAVTLPKVGSLILTHDLNGEVKGLNEFPDAHPPVAPVFFAFRVMVGVGMLMIGLSVWGRWSIRGERKPSPLLLRSLMLMTFSGWVATLAGWYVTEIGRQPFIVYGQILVSDVVADHPGSTVAGSLFAFVLLYSFLLVAFIAAIKNMASKPAASLIMGQAWPEDPLLGSERKIPNEGAH